MARLILYGCEGPGCRPGHDDDPPTPEWVRLMRYHLRRSGVLQRKRERRQQTMPSKYPGGIGSSTAYHPVEAMNGSNHS
jgi:hypothetical protein